MEIQDLNSKSLTEKNKDIIAVQKIIENLLNSKELLEEQREDLKRFDKYLIANNKLTNTRRNYLTPLKKFAIFVKKPFKEVTRNDVEDFLVMLKSEKRNAICVSQSVLKMFFKWLYGMKKGQYPEQVDWVKIEKPKQKMPTFLTEEEIKKMISVCDCIRDKCILSVLFESGCRIGEIIPLNISDIEFDKQYPIARFNVKNVEGCKTGSRNFPIPLVNSLPILREWLNSHPLRNQEDAPLFVSFKPDHFGERLFRQGYFQMIQKYVKRAGIKKKVGCHTFRHSQFRDMRRKGFSLMDLKEKGGWRRFDQVMRYSSWVDSEQLEDKMLQMNGYKKFKEVEKEEKLKPKICLFCSTPNDSTNRICIKCNQPLDQKEIMEKEKIRSEFEERFFKMMPFFEKLEKLSENPKFLSMLEK